MRAIFTWPAASLLVLLFSYPAFAQVVWYSPALQRPLGYAPDACGRGFYAQNRYGQWFGPNYYLRPCFPPENGVGPGNVHRRHQQIRYQYRPMQVHPHQPPVMMPVPMRIAVGGLPPIHSLPQLPRAQAPAPPKPSFPSHPFARSPRDFFMWGAAYEDEISRLRHPSLVP